MAMSFATRVEVPRKWCARSAMSFIRSFVLSAHIDDREANPSASSILPPEAACSKASATVVASSTGMSFPARRASATRRRRAEAVSFIRQAAGHTIFHDGSAPARSSAAKRSFLIESCCGCCALSAAPMRRRGFEVAALLLRSCCGHVQSFPVSHTNSLVRPTMFLAASPLRSRLSSPLLWASVRSSSQ